MNVASTFFLFARPSFWEGVARILDFGNVLTEYNKSLTPQQADALAMRADWVTVGEDIQSAADTLFKDSGQESARAFQG